MTVVRRLPNAKCLNLGIQILVRTGKSIPWMLCRLLLLSVTGSLSSRRKLPDGHDCCFKSCWHKLRRNTEHSAVKLQTRLLSWDPPANATCVHVNSEPGVCVFFLADMLTGPNRSAAMPWSTRIPMPSWSGSWRPRCSGSGTCCSLRACRSCWIRPVCHTYTWLFCCCCCWTLRCRLCLLCGKLATAMLLCCVSLVAEGLF